MLTWINISLEEVGIAVEQAATCTVEMVQDGVTEVFSRKDNLELIDD